MTEPASFPQLEQAFSELALAASRLDDAEAFGLRKLAEFGRVCRDVVFRTQIMDDLEHDPIVAVTPHLGQLWSGIEPTQLEESEIEWHRPAASPSRSIRTRMRH